jgi:type 1 glutamine amidotransferase/sugar phosphate isomerase/epimerase
MHSMQRVVPLVLPLALVGTLSASVYGIVAAAAGHTQADTRPQAGAAQADAPTPLAARAPDAIERVTWRTRTLVGDERLTQWPLAIRLDSLTFLDAVMRADAAVVNFVEGWSTQQVSAVIQKPLDHRLSADEIAALRRQMGTIRLLTYRVVTLSADPAERRQVLAFARAMGATTVLVPGGTKVDGLDTVAEEIGVNVAVASGDANPGALVRALDGKGRRLGIGLDTGLLTQQGITPAAAVTAAGSRLLHLNLRDASESLFHELNRLNVRPVALTLDLNGVVKAPGDIFPAIEAFEAVVQPAYGQHFTAFSKTRPIRWDLVSPREAAGLSATALAQANDTLRQKIVAAVPARPFATPKKPRKLLVIESLHGMSHNTIPHTNVMIEHFGKATGAWTAVFDNDLSNLTYPKIAEYDAIFLNSIVGELFADPRIRDSVARYVREGGGLGGIHGTPWASRNWNEFADMIGAQDAPHRIEKGVMKVYDAASPLVAALRDRPLPFAEEYYRFRHEGRARLRWDQVRVLLTVALDDPSVEPRPWTGYTRPDRTYPVSWVRTYGKGRVFYSSIGHMPETFMTPALVSHLLAGLQYVAGDLEADATPNPPTPVAGSR